MFLTIWGSPRLPDSTFQNLFDHLGVPDGSQASRREAVLSRVSAAFWRVLGGTPKLYFSIFVLHHLGVPREGGASQIGSSNFFLPIWGSLGEDPLKPSRWQSPRLPGGPGSQMALFNVCFDNLGVPQAPKRYFSTFFRPFRGPPGCQTALPTFF